MKTKFPQCKDCKVLYHEGYSLRIQRELCKRCDGKGNFDKRSISEIDEIKEYESLKQTDSIMPLHSYWNDAEVRKLL